MKRLVVDNEANNLLANMLDFSSLPYKMNEDARLWCVVVRDVDTDEVISLSSHSGNTITKDQMKEVFEGCTEIIAHNGIKFDFIALDLFGVLDYFEGGFCGAYSSWVTGYDEEFLRYWRRNLGSKSGSDIVIS